MIFDNVSRCGGGGGGGGGLYRHHFGEGWQLICG